MSNITTDVPDKFLIPIGKIIVLWALIEYRLKKNIYDLAGIKQKYGRAVVKDIPADIVVRTMSEILAISDKVPNATEKELKDFAKLLAQAAAARNELVHGTWAENRDGGDPLLRIVKGERDEPDRREGQRPLKIDPGLRRITVNGLHKQIATLEDIHGQLEWLREVFLRKPLPSPAAPASDSTK